MKKFISLLIAMTMCMSLFAVSALADGETTLTDDQTFDFESYDAPYSFASGYTDGCLGTNIANANDKVEVVSSGESRGNVLKVNHSENTTQVGYPALKSASPTYLWNISFDIKLDDLNDVRQFAYFLHYTVYPELIFNTNGTVELSDGQIIDDLVIETGKWYNFNVTITSYNEVYIKATTESGDVFTAVGGRYTYLDNPNAANRRLYFSVMGEQSGVYYLDNIDLTPAATNHRYGFEDFDDITVGTDVTQSVGFKTLSYDYNYSKGDNYTTMVAVVREGDDNALKITKGVGTTGQSEVYGWGGYNVSNADINYDIKLMDKNVERRIIANDGSDRYVLTFKEDGTVAVCGTAIPGFVYESGANAPWYNVKIYTSVSESKVIAVISDGENIVKGEGTMTFNAAGISKTYLYIVPKNGGNLGEYAPSETYVDNIIFKEFFPPAGFFTKAISFSFDDMVDASKTVPQGYTGNTYHTFSVHNNNAGTTNGTGAVIDGRKVLSVNRLTDNNGSYANTTLRLTSITSKYFKPDRIEFDVKLPTDISDLGIQVSTGKDIWIVKLEANGAVQCLGQEAVQSVYGNWHRVAIDYDFTGDGVTYDIKVVDLDRNELVCSYEDISSSNTVADGIDYLLINGSMYAGERFYVDNVSLYSADAAPYVMGSTFLKEGAEPHLGSAVLLNHALDPSNAGNKLVINGTTYVGAEANKFLDARFANTASFTGLEGNTSYNIAYKLYDMFGGVEEGTTIFTTGESYAFGDITLSKEGTLTAGDVTATLNGKISADMGASLIFALYEKGGNEMIEAKTVNIGWSRDADTYTVTLTVPEAGEYEVRAFLWDDAIRPIKLPVTLAQ